MQHSKFIEKGKIEKKTIERVNLKNFRASLRLSLSKPFQKSRTPRFRIL